MKCINCNHYIHIHEGEVMHGNSYWHSVLKCHCGCTNPKQKGVLK